MDEPKRTTVKDVIHYHKMLHRAAEAGYSATHSGVESFIKDLRKKRWWNRKTDEERAAMMHPPILYQNLQPVLLYDPRLIPDTTQLQRDMVTALQYDMMRGVNLQTATGAAIQANKRRGSLSDALGIASRLGGGWI